MDAITLPDSIRQFVMEQVTIEIPPDAPVFPYAIQEKFDEID